MLVELGLPGYLLVTLVRVGLILALVRAHRTLASQGRRPFAGLALALIPIGVFGQIAMDHVYQALFFTGAGFVLAACSDPAPPLERPA
jgi:hypothetical protein